MMVFLGIYAMCCEYLAASQIGANDVSPKVAKPNLNFLILLLTKRSNCLQPFLVIFVMNPFNSSSLFLFLMGQFVYIFGPFVRRDVMASAQSAQAWRKS